MQNKNLKLKLSLCGLALTSFLALNTHSIVHADTVQNANNNAITWDSDNDDSQAVKSEPQQDKASQPVQSRVQVSYSQPVQNKKVMVSNVSSVLSSQSVRNRAEKSNLRQSNVQTSTVNRLNANTARLQVKIAHLNDAVPANRVVINNPQNNQVIVHYIKGNGQSANLADQTIDVTKTGQGSYTVPSGYSLNVPDGKYNVSGGKLGVDMLKGNVEHHNAVGKYALDNTNLDDLDSHWNQFLSSDKTPVGKKYGIYRYYGDLGLCVFDAKGQPTVPDNLHDFIISSGNYDDEGYNATLAAVMRYVYSSGRDSSDYEFKIGRTDDETEIAVPLTLVSYTPAYDVQHLPVAFVDSNNNIVGMIQNYTGKVGTTQNVNLTLPTGYKLADGTALPTSVTFQNSTDPLLVKVVPSGKTQSITNPANNTIHVNFVDQEIHQSVGTGAIDLTKQQSGRNYYVTPDGYVADVGTYDVQYNPMYISKCNFVINNDIKDGTQHTVNIPETSDVAFTADELKFLGDYFGTQYPIRVAEEPGNLKYDTYNAVWDLWTVSAGGSGKEMTLYMNNSYTKDGQVLYDNANMITSLRQSIIAHQKAEDAIRKAQDKNYVGLADQGFYINLKDNKSNAGYQFTDDYHAISGNTVTVPVHKTNSFSFADNSGNVKSVVGNVVNVVVTKPVSVNDASQTRKSATRVISVSLPDDQGARDRYKGVLNSNNQIVQTINFTRSVTQDALTGNVLSETNWQGPSSFPAVTLPDIPGYTMTMS